jgi:hypothetical protein
MTVVVLFISSCSCGVGVCRKGANDGHADGCSSDGGPVYGNVRGDCPDNNHCDTDNGDADTDVIPDDGDDDCGDGITLMVLLVMIIKVMLVLMVC